MIGDSSLLAEPKKKARIEIIPLIDVIFFLLATFVLFTLSLNRIISIPVQLPESVSNPAPPDPDMVTLQMSGGDSCYWIQGQQPAELILAKDIAPRLEHYKTEVSTPKVLVTGDQQAHFGATVFALDQVRKAGITQVSVATETKNSH